MVISSLFTFQFRVERLAWASAQLLCQCSVSESRIILPATDETEKNTRNGIESSTSFVPSRGECQLALLVTFILSFPSVLISYL